VELTGATFYDPMSAMPRSFTAIIRLPTPKEADLFRRRIELAALRAELSRCEATLEQLRAQIFSFEGRYIRQVGVLYIQLDEWEDRIAELNSPPVLPEGAEWPEGGKQAELQPATLPPDEAQPGELVIELKALFHEVAKRIHPDFACDALDECRRTHLMAQANAAYLRNDAAILQRMLHGYDPATGNGDKANELTHTLTLIARCREDISQLAVEIASIEQSEMVDLQRRTILAAAEGRDLLAELAAQVKGRIGIAMRRYELDLGRRRRKQAAFNPEPLLSAEIR
jgi:hypothetical protein